MRRRANGQQPGRNERFYLYLFWPDERKVVLAATNLFVFRKEIAQSAQMGSRSH